MNETLAPSRIEVQQNPLLIVGLEEKYRFGSPMNPADQWQKFAQWIDKIPGHVNGVTYGLCLDLDQGKGIRYLCGVQVVDTRNLSDQLVAEEIRPGKYAVFPHKEHVSTLNSHIDDIWQKWFPTSGYETPEDADLFFERYGESYDPVAGNGNIEIWIPVK